MKIKLNLLACIIILASSIPLHAENFDTILDEDGNTYMNNSEVCANTPLHIWNLNDELEVLILDQDTHLVYDVFNVTKYMPDIVFPVNAGDVELMVNKFNKDGTLDTKNPSKIDLSVTDCGVQTNNVYDSVNDQYITVPRTAKDDYKNNKPQFKLEYNGEKLKIIPGDKTDYAFEYQFVKEKSKTKSKKINFNKKSEIQNIKTNIIQIKESYLDDDAKEVNNYYELELYPDSKEYNLREVYEFGLEEIKGMSVIDSKIIIFIICLIIFYKIVNIAYKKQKSRYRKHQIKEMRLKKNDESKNAK